MMQIANAAFDLRLSALDMMFMNYASAALVLLAFSMLLWSRR